MNQKLLFKFGNPIERVEKAISALQSGEGIIILDDEKRENEGDLVFSSENMTVEQMALAIRYGSGIVCLCITESKRKKLNLPMMVKKYQYLSYWIYYYNRSCKRDLYWRISTRSINYYKNSYK